MKQNLCNRCDKLRKANELLASHVLDMLSVMTDIYKAATGENQVADDDTGGLAWIAEKVRPLVIPPSAPVRRANAY
jgi:hypothetical protein